MKIVRAIIAYILWCIKKILRAVQFLLRAIALLFLAFMGIGGPIFFILMMRDAGSIGDQMDQVLMFGIIFMLLFPYTGYSVGKILINQERKERGLPPLGTSDLDKDLDRGVLSAFKMLDTQQKKSRKGRRWR